MKFTVIDIETDGLLETVTKIHCLSYTIIDNGVEVQKGSFTNYSEIKEFILSQRILVGHNIIIYDIPVLELILNIKINAKLVDTLALSWYLYPLRPKHGLEYWGDELGVKKPIILDWQNLSIQEYIKRCEADVQINILLFKRQFSYLNLIYNNNLQTIQTLIDYLGFKMDCAREQEEEKCKLNIPLIKSSLNDLTRVKEEKELALISSMPRDTKFKEVKKPTKLTKIDGSLTVRATKWYDLLEELNLPEDTEEPVMVLDSNEEGNPASHIQIKNWLDRLGWTPTTFEYRKNSKGDIRPVPQIYGDEGVCDSIKALYEIEPALENLDMLSLINHRIGVFKSFLENSNEEGYTKAGIHGFTNTLRFRHRKPIANLPKVFKFYGEQIRGAIIAPTHEHVLCGSDMSSLEDTTKQHYMYFFDPDYVNQMRVPGFDPHLDIAVLAKMLTEEQAEAHKNKVEDHSQTRGKAKVVNFSGIYGAGPPKIAVAAGIPLNEAKILHKIYWQRNKAVKLVEKSCTIKELNYTEFEKYTYEVHDEVNDTIEVKTAYKEVVKTQMWLYNPVSGFWYSLRFLKDKFSTLNQGTGVFVFDLWVREVRKRGLKIMLQYHDEIVLSLYKGNEDRVNKILQEAIEEVNNKVGLNVPLGVDVQFGNNYAKIH